MPHPLAARTTNVVPPEGTALFLIGMRVTRPWRVRAWLAVFAAMPKMLIHLRRRPEAGMLGAQLYLGGSLMVLSYWRSADDIRRFAADPDAPHLPVWRWFNRELADTGSVGIWHETYVIGEHETVSSGMPPWGLVRAVGGCAVDASTATAGRRLARSRNGSSG
ncbi:DUF4188 domain-containing protein [Gordonia sp. zg691]|uniref:DUF4188 domain-containing protein n=1 Tax=Gordonia jinghuaiqii TaxID=2758710 RepID=UPI0016622293|nr:DUF4188 domain-containing protein [Gordonia jinghuaiqii]MBD0861079.1 DUF4188 domain-containing protein [Gordonia jinghuaiqii]